MDSLPIAEKSEAMEVAAPEPIPTRVEEVEHKTEYLPLWQLLPIFVAMGLGIFILGLASILLAVRQTHADTKGPRIIPS
jgi:hypothetical protein